MEEKIEKCKVRDLDEFLEVLGEGRPVVIYDDYICCQSRLDGRKSELLSAIKSSDTKIYGALACGSGVYEKEEARKMGKFLVSSECKSVEDIVDELTWDDERKLACEIFGELFGYKADGLSETCPFVELFVEPTETTKDRKKLVYTKDDEMRPEVDYHRLLTEIDKAFSEKRIMLLEEIPSWKAYDKETGEIAYATGCIDVQGTCCLKDGKIIGRAESIKEYFPFTSDSKGLKPMMDSVAKSGLELDFRKKMVFHIDEEVESIDLRDGYCDVIKTSSDSRTYSLLGDMKKTAEYTVSVRERIKEVLGVREHYKSLVEGLFE